TRRRFTGQTLDFETGLYYYGARYYDPMLGRFYQPDSIVPEPGDPQSLNRFAYTLNNPLTYIDSDGQCPIPAPGLGSGQIICIAGFIPTAETDAVITTFTGDDRAFTAYGIPGAESSRFWAWIDAETGETLFVEFHPTCVAGGECTPARPVDCGRGNNCFRSWMNEDGSITVEYQAICSAPGGLAAACQLTASGSVTFIPHAEGGFDTTGAVDRFPNLEAYYWDWTEGLPAQVDTLFQFQNYSAAERELGMGTWQTGLRMLFPQYSWLRRRPLDQDLFPFPLPPPFFQ
ncbi:MAG: RHS repeat-associated core domain-containing protein, partial [Ardenticatenaceae bacterium]